MKPLSSLKLMPSSVLVLFQQGLASESRPTESNVFVSRTHKEGGKYAYHWELVAGH